MERIKRSPQWVEKTFTNPLKEEKIAFASNLWRWLRGVDHSKPESPIDTAKPRHSELSKHPVSGLRLTWLGHSTFLVELDGVRILIDPVWADRASPFSYMGPKRFFAPPLALSSLPNIDAVVISHDHYDHLDHQTIVTLKDKVPLFIMPLGVGAHFQSWGVAEEKIVELDWWQSRQIKGVTLVATPARHFSGRSLTDRNQTLWAGWAFQGPKHRIFYSGDTAMFPEFADIGKRLGPFDLTLMEVGAYDAGWRDVHMGPEQAIQAHTMVRGGILLPAHWGTFDLALHSWTEPVERLLVAAEKANVRLALPRPGQSFELNDIPQQKWWPKVPWKSAEEAPVISSGLPVL